jgi:hypothetical protein
MSNQFGVFALSDLSWSGPDPFSSGSSRSSSAISNGTVITVSPSATRVILDVTDNDPLFEDGDSGQRLVGPVTLGGTTYPTNTSVENEYSYVVRPVGSTDPADEFFIYAVEFGSKIVAAASSRPLVPGQSYEIRPGGSNSPSPTYASLYVCFTPGTRIGTPCGSRRIEHLAPGDMVLTLDNGAQPVVWVGRRRIRADAAQAPVLIAPGVLQNTRSLRLSPQHRVLWQHAGHDVLVPVKALLRCRGVRQLPAGPVTYLHVLLPRHEIVRAEGAAVETLLPGPMALSTLSSNERAAIRPFLLPDAAPARPILAAGRARSIARR